MWKATLMGLLVVLLVGCDSQRGSSPTPIADYKIGKPIIVRGRLAIVTNGANEVMEINGPKLPNASPVLAFDTTEGIRVACGFSDVRRDEFSRWIEKNKLGTTHTVRGVYWGTAPGGVHTISDTELLSGDFPKRVSP